jgi:excisionase family DNA binding protein
LTFRSEVKGWRAAEVEPPALGRRASEWLRNWLVRRFHDVLVPSGRGGRAAGLSRSQLYELIRSGRLQTVTEGRVRLIPAAAIDAYVSLLTVEARAAGGDDAA